MSHWHHPNCRLPNCHRPNLSRIRSSRILHELVLTNYVRLMAKMEHGVVAKLEHDVLARLVWLSIQLGLVEAMEEEVEFCVC